MVPRRPYSPQKYVCSFYKWRKVVKKIYGNIFRDRPFWGANYKGFRLKMSVALTLCIYHISSQFYLKPIAELKDFPLEVPTRMLIIPRFQLPLSIGHST